MHDIDALEAINAEQLATATDWLLLRSVRKSRPKLRGLTVDLQDAPTMHVRAPAPRKRRRSVVVIVATGIVAASASLAVGVACLLL